MLSSNVELFFWLGVSTFAFCLFTISWEIFKGFRHFVWANIGPAKNFKTSYGKWAVVTGGSDGIGKGYAMELAKRGMNICVISKDEFKIVDQIRALFEVKVIWIDADFTDPHVYDGIEKRLSELDDIGILVNNVGLFIRELHYFVQEERNSLDRMVEVNVKAVAMMTHIVLKRMLTKNRGLIVNIGSMSSVTPFPFASIYGATKNFVESFSLSLDAELVNTNVRVHCVRPFFVNTALVGGIGKLTRIFSPVFFPTASKFAESSAALLNLRTVPLFSSGYWAHSLILFVLPLKFLSKSFLAKIFAMVQKQILGFNYSTSAAEGFQ